MTTEIPAERRENSNPPVRRLVLDILMEAEQSGSYGSQLVRRAQDRYASLDHAQRSFLRRLSLGVIGGRIRLDAVLQRLCSKPVSRMDPVVRNILRMGIYQILYMDRVPVSAACDEAVRLTRQMHRNGLTGFVNGVLRSAARQREELLSFIASSRDPEIRYALPRWIFSMWSSQYGRARADGIAKALDQERPVTVRVDARIDPDVLCSRWKQAGLDIRPSRILPFAFDLPEGVNPSDIPGFAEGWCTVQDASSMVVGIAAGIRGGETILDICAAPGGKTLHCASLLAAAGRGGQVRAFDLYPAKISRIQENVRRMRLEAFIKASVRDAREPVPPAEEGSADILLCDLPCSGLGVCRRKPEIRYRVKPDDLSSLGSLQRSILREAVRYLKPGGTLIYSTCTIDRTENDETADFIGQELGLMPRTMEPLLPASLCRSLYGPDRNYLQLYPDLHGTDGFFLASFQSVNM